MSCVLRSLLRLDMPLDDVIKRQANNWESDGGGSCSRASRILRIIGRRALVIGSCGLAIALRSGVSGGASADQRGIP